MVATVQFVLILVNPVFSVFAAEMEASESNTGVSSDDIFAIRKDR